MWEKVRKLAVPTVGGDGGPWPIDSAGGHLAALRQMSADLGPCTPLQGAPPKKLPRSMRDTPGGVHCSVICGRGDGRTWVSLLGKHEEAKSGSGVGWGGVQDAPRSTNSSKSTSVFTGQPGWILKL